MENNILFDDWKVRQEGIFNRRKKDYNIGFICVIGRYRLFGWESFQERVGG